MKLCRAFSLAVFGAGLAALTVASPACAQANYPGEGVEVNPPPPSERGADVLLYPGTNVVGVQGPLLEPGASYPETRIKLIPPDEVKRRKAAAAAARLAKQQQIAVPQTIDASIAPSEIAPPPPPAKKKNAQPTVQQAVVAPDEPITFAPAPQHAAAAQTTTNSANRVPFSLSPTSPDIIIGAHGKPQEQFHASSVAPPKKIPVQTRTASAPASHQPAVATPRQPETATLESSAPPPAAIVASITPVSLTPKPDTHRGLSKRSEIVFPEGAVDPTPDTITDLRKLASDLGGALHGTARVQLEAFGGTPGDKSSDARRLSLKRALAVRALLIESGVPAERIDVRALGGTTDGGTPDRVDVFVRTG